jgi:hypothetical protein
MAGGSPNMGALPPAIDGVEGIAATIWGEALGRPIGYGCNDLPDWHALDVTARSPPQTISGDLPACLATLRVRIAISQRTRPPKLGFSPVF